MNIFLSCFDGTRQRSQIIATSLLLLLSCGRSLQNQHSPTSSSQPVTATTEKTSPSAYKLQMTTMGSIITVAAAWQTYFNDYSSYCPNNTVHPKMRWGNIGIKEMESFLVPTYIQHLPRKDGWGGSLQFAVQCMAKGAQAYSIRSAGSDGQWDGEDYMPGSCMPQPISDIVFANGQFVQRPEGSAQMPPNW